MSPVRSCLECGSVTNGPQSWAPGEDQGQCSECRPEPVRSPVASTRKRRAGLYRVTLANGAEAKVSRDNAVSGDEAVESFREYRG